VIVVGDAELDFIPSAFFPSQAIMASAIKILIQENLIIFLPIICDRISSYLLVAEKECGYKTLGSALARSRSIGMQLIH
jgi:hypothetical protein